MQNQNLTGWFTTLLLIFIGSAIIAVILWNYFSKETPCLSLLSKNWLGIGWVTFLAGTLTAIFLNDCTTSWWWFIIGFLLVLTIVAFILWDRKYKTSYKEIAYFLFACLLAQVIANNFFIKEVFRV